MIPTVPGPTLRPGTHAGPGRSPIGRVLVVEDDPSVAEVVGRYLEREGFVVIAASDGREGLRRAATALDLVVLDLTLPGLDGLELLRRLRALVPVPVVVLTARAEESDRVQGLELGADDYVVKPFSPRELVARVRAVLRRTSESGAGPCVPDVLHAGELEVDPLARQVRVRGRPVGLTAREFDLLVFLMSRRGRVCRREELLEQLWGARHGNSPTLTVHVRRLREKVEADPSAPQWIKTVWGIGYRFDG